MTEVLQGIRQVKFAGLERKWEAKINQLRNNELQAQQTSFNWQVIYVTLHLLAANVSIKRMADFSGFNVEKEGVTASENIQFISATLSYHSPTSRKKVGTLQDINPLIGSDTRRV
ncbi:hypothetical protein EYZ11_003182 [Aspergillus tanneri]|uniref:Uncharacterized protein n=1 Tax=Aspergillus tanneri TaxID=1220188 RepID=A0A4S3JR31_9EURO|nr:hypothetical protein EYZ11_003182 [Aspergillus tanneri]